MGIYEELVARGLIAQVTDENEIRDMVNNGKATFYIGFDCTAATISPKRRYSAPRNSSRPANALRRNMKPKPRLDFIGKIQYNPIR